MITINFKDEMGFSTPQNEIYFAGREILTEEGAKFVSDHTDKGGSITIYNKIMNKTFIYPIKEVESIVIEGVHK